MAEETQNEKPDAQPQNTENTQKAEKNRQNEQSQNQKTPPSGEHQDSPTQPEQQSRETDKDARMWAMFSHLAGLAGYVMPVIGNIVAPLIIWQLKKEDFAFVDEQGKEAVNFQISMVIYGAIASALILVVIGILLLPAVIILHIIFLLIAAVKANDGFHYRYPITIRFIK